MYLATQHPELPTCANCIKYLYNRDWSPVYERTADGVKRKQEPRPKKCGTPCDSCPKIPKGVVPKPENAIELSDKNKQAYWYRAQCHEDTTGILPRDRIVIRNNALITLAEKGIDREQNQTWLHALLMRGRPNGRS